MALLTILQPSIVGTTFTAAAASGGGDTVDPTGGDVVLHYINGSGGAITVTVVRPGTEYGVANPDPTVSVGAGATKMIGPIPDEFADPDTGLVSITYSGVTSLTVAAVRL
jgi:hypothetical protein